jgi:hypothetical protein
VTASAEDVLDPAATAGVLDALYARREALLVELARTDRAIRAIRAPGQPDSPRVTRRTRGTWPMMRSMIYELGPGAQFDVEWALQWLQRYDWQTSAKDRRQTVASVCSRLKIMGELRPGGSPGVYEVPPAPGRADAPADDDAGG